MTNVSWTLLIADAIIWGVRRTRFSFNIQLLACHLFEDINHVQVTQVAVIKGPVSRVNIWSIFNAIAGLAIQMFRYFSFGWYITSALRPLSSPPACYLDPFKSPLPVPQPATEESMLIRAGTSAREEEPCLLWWGEGKYSIKYFEYHPWFCIRC